MDNDCSDTSIKPTRRDVMAGAGAAALTLSVVPAARATSRFPVVLPMVLQFDVPEPVPVSETS